METKIQVAHVKFEKTAFEFQTNAAEADKK